MRIKFIAIALFASLLLVSCSQGTDVSVATSSTEESVVSNEVLMSEDELRDKILGSWVGQMAGVAWGAPTEFAHRGITIPDSEVPTIGTTDINTAFAQDDLYVEIPFIQTMSKNGYDCSLDLLAESFKNSTFPLDHANKIARENLQKGIKAPMSGHYSNSIHSDDIDWQIEADFVGTIYPGLVNEAAQRAFEIGHIMNYGDGVYGGVFISAMHSASFTAENLDEIIQAGIKSIPVGSQFRTLMDEVIKLHDENKTWQECWQAIEYKWGAIDRCLWYGTNDANIDAKLNSAYVLMGLLYGDGDFNKSVKIAMQCGQDSDCNPSSVGAILGNFYGYSGLPAEWKNGISMNGEVFAYTNYTLKNAVDVNLEVMLKALAAKGFEKRGENWVINPTTEIIPVLLEQWPDMPSVEASVVFDKGLLQMSLSTYDLSGIKSIKWDMGDGTVYNENTSLHLYTEIGKYEVSCVITNNNNNSYTYKTEVDITELYESISDEESGTLRNIAYCGIPICSVSTPIGGSGNKDINIIRDGVKSGINTDQYDTFMGDVQAHDDYIGYLFAQEFEISSVVFYEGMHFDNGGWFADDTLKLQALIDGNWTTIDSVITPVYPNGNAKSDFGEDFDEYKFSFDKVACKGLRLIGKAGGVAGFIGVAELEVTGVESK